MQFFDLYRRLMTSPTVGRRVISVMQQSFNGSFNCKSAIKEYGLTQAGVLFALKCWIRLYGLGGSVGLVVGSESCIVLCFDCAFLVQDWGNLPS